MAIYSPDQSIEFDLTIRVKDSREDFDPYMPKNLNSEPEIVVKEELKFNSLDGVSVIRKILDYVYSR